MKLMPFELFVTILKPAEFQEHCLLACRFM